MDWNSDGYRDIVSGDRNGYFNVFIQDSTTSDSLTAYKQYRLLEGNIWDVGSNSQPAVFDWDNDGVKDIIMGHESRQVRLYLNQAGDTWPLFQDYELVQAGGSNISLYRVNPYMFDLDQDGLDDLICGENNGYIHFYRNIGSLGAPEFAADEQLSLANGTPIRYPLGSRYGSRCGFGDWNNDSIPDFLLGTFEGHIAIYLGLAPVGINDELRMPISGFRVSPVPGGPPVQFAVTLTRTATLAVLDNSGRVVRTLGTLDPGNSSVAWNGLDKDGLRVPALRKRL